MAFLQTRGNGPVSEKEYELKYLETKALVINEDAPDYKARGDEGPS